MEKVTKQTLLDDWREVRRLFRKVADQTPHRMMSGGKWDRAVRIWDDLDRIIEEIEKMDDRF